MGVPKVVPEEVFGHTDSFGSFSMNICREAKDRIFSNGGYWKSSFFTRFCPQGTRRVDKLSWDWFSCTSNELTNTKRFLKPLCVHKNQSQGSFSTRRIPFGQKRVKNDDLKIWLFWAKWLISPPPPPPSFSPLEKIRVLTSRQIFIEKLPSEPVCPKTSSVTTFGTLKGPESKK